MRPGALPLPADISQCGASLTVPVRVGQAKGWASDVYAGVDSSGYEHNQLVYMLSTHVTLTEAGLAAAPGAGLAVAGVVFQYIKMLKAPPLPFQPSARPRPLPGQIDCYHGSPLGSCLAAVADPAGSRPSALGVR